MVSTSVIYVITWITIYYSFTDPREMEGWVGLIRWPKVDSLLTKWSPVTHRSGIGQRKSASQRSMS